jgi:PDZ domain-containing protein
MIAARLVNSATVSAMTTDTTDGMVPSGSEGGPSPDASPGGVSIDLPGRWHRWWALPLAAAAIVFPTAVAIAGVVPSRLVARELNERIDEMQPAPYARVPASAQPVGDRITLSPLEPDGELGDVVDASPAGSVDDVPSVYDAEGDVFLVTITEPAQSVLSWLVGRGEPAVEMLTREERFGLQTPEQRRVFSLESMRTAQETAQFVALEWLGYAPRIVPGDVLISEMVCLEFDDAGSECLRMAPSDEVLDPGDRLLEADGRALGSVEDLVAVLAEHSPGDVISIEVDRRGTGRFIVDVELTSAPDDPERTIVGFIPFDTRRIVLPFDIDIDTGSIGGPSAGLAFTLTLIDALTEGELTGGGRVAATGTIQLDGSVGAIGGLRQKASAVSQAGIELFIVPSAQRPEDVEAARAAAPDLEIVTVASLDEAVDVLVAAGGTRPAPLAAP